MEVLSRGPSYGVVDLCPNEVVAELETTVHFSEKPFVLQPRQGLTCGSCTQVHSVVVRQVRKAPTKNGSQVEGRSRGCVKAPHLPFENRTDCSRDSDVGGRLCVQRLKVTEKRARAVR